MHEETEGPEQAVQIHRCARARRHAFAYALPRLSVPLAVTSVVMQKNGAGLHTATSCFWDNTSDGRAAPDPRAIAACSRPARVVLAGSATVRWENKTMYCITTVFGLSI